MALNDEQRTFVAERHEAMYDQMFYYAYNFLKNDEWTRDAIQETFHTACAKIDSFMTSPVPNGWLIITLSHKMLNIARTEAKVYKQALKVLATEDQSYEDNYESIGLRRELAEHLSEDDFSILMLHHSGYSIQEIADSLDITLEAGKKRLQRAKQRAQKIIEKFSD